MVKTAKIRKSKSTEILSDGEILGGFDKRQLQREKKKDKICDRYAEIDAKLAQAKKAGDSAAIKRLEAQAKKCTWEISLVDLNEAEDRLSREQAEKRHYEKFVKSKFVDANTKIEYENWLVGVEERIFDYEIEVRQAQELCRELAPKKVTGIRIMDYLKQRNGKTK